MYWAFGGRAMRVIEGCYAMCLVLRDRLALFDRQSNLEELLLVAGFGISWDLSGRELRNAGSDWSRFAYEKLATQQVAKQDDSVPVDVVLWLGLFEKSQGLREVVIKHNCFMP